MIKNYTLLFLALISSFLLQAQQWNEGILSQKLQNALLESPDDQQLVYVQLADRIDVKALETEFIAKNLLIEERVHILITTLKNKASQSQPALINYLSNLPGADPTTIRPFWISNVVFVQATSQAISNISHRPDVFWIDLNVENVMDEYVNLDCEMPPSPNGTEPGLEAIDAPALWAMGYTGYGQVAFTADTGIEPNHPAIDFKYRGYYVDHSETWVEFNDFGVVTGNTTPSECGDHGNHTIGTVLGLDRNVNDTIGVAFNAQWIGTAILCGIGTVDNIAAFQWALDPDNNTSTTEDMPDVINNSWRDPSIAGNDCFSVYVDALNALEAAGIANIFSAGNEGPGVSTITPPHNINTDTFNCFTVGALNGNISTFPITDFSSRGPSDCGGAGSLLIKPEVSAPGESVRSCEHNGSYGQKSGTSMAAPHVAGAVLLLKEAFPYLTGKDLLRAIYHSCVDLGEIGEDNTYGMGIINVLDAFNLLIDQGHVPASPHVDNDALLVGLPLDELYCEGSFAGSIVFENAGMAPLTSLEINYTIKDQTGALIAEEQALWTDSLNTRERATFFLPEISLTNGNYEVNVELLLPNGIPDEKPLNNRGSAPFSIFEGENFSLSVVSVDTASTCAGASTLLYCDYEGEAGEVFWYNVPIGGASQGQGNYFSTPEQNFDFTYYADVKVTDYAGKVALDDDASDIGQDNGGMVIDAQYPFTIVSVKVYADEVGARFITLSNEDGDLINQRPLFISDPGEQRLELNLPVPKGENMVIRQTFGNPLYYSTEADYPYDVAGIAQVKTSTHQFAPNDTWFYLYDWEVRYDYFCGRKSIDVQVVESDNVPEVAFEASAEIVDFNNIEPVQFTDQSVDAVSWLWHFGDGTSSTEQHPEHLFDELGVYTVGLTIVGPDGCTNSTTKTISVEKLVDTKQPFGEDGYLWVYPNPANDRLVVDYHFTKNSPLQLQVMDALGQIVHTQTGPYYNRGQLVVDSSNWPGGMYFVLLSDGIDRVVSKVIRQ